MAKLSIDEVKKGNLGMFSLIAGGLAVLLVIVTIIGRIIANFLCCFGCLLMPFLCISGLAAFILAVAAIVLGIIALVSKKEGSKGMAIGGIALGFIYFAIQILYIIVVIIFWGFTALSGN